MLQVLEQTNKTNKQKRANKYRSIFIIFQNNVERFMLQYMCITKYKAEQ